MLLLIHDHASGSTDAHSSVGGVVAVLACLFILSPFLGALRSHLSCKDMSARGKEELTTSAHPEMIAPPYGQCWDRQSPDEEETSIASGEVEVVVDILALSEGKLRE